MKTLILVDLQNDFITGSLGTVEAQAIIPNVIESINSWDPNDPIVLTKDTHYADYLYTLEGYYLPVEHCILNTTGHDIDSRIEDALNGKNVFTIEKSSFGAKYLSEVVDPSSELYLCGLCTDICVVSNALLLRSIYPDSEIYCIEKCCAGTTPENHEAAIKVMKSCQIEII